MEKEKMLNTSEAGKAITYLGIGEVVPSSENNYDVDSYEELIGSIRTFGLQSPITVIGPNDDGKYEILSGERRYRACSALHDEDASRFSEIPAYIIGSADMGRLEKQLRIEVSNLDVRDNIDIHMHRMNVIRIITEMKKSDGTSRAELNRALDEYLRVTPRYRRYYVSIVENGIERLQECVKDGSLPLKTASWISSQDVDGQNEILGMIDDGVEPDGAIAKYKHEHGLLSEEERAGSAADKEIRERYKDAFEPDILSAKEEQIINGLFDDEIEESSKSSHINDNADSYLNLRGDIDDLFDSFKGSAGDVNLAIDTSGRLKGMVAEAHEENHNRRASLLMAVDKWLSKVISSGDYSSEEEPLIAKCKTIAEMF